MKLKIILLIPSLVVSFSLFAQFSLETEYSYLKFINNQQKDILIEDNVKNSELAVDKLTANIETLDKYAALFLIELVNSNILTKNNSFAFFYSLYQRSLFPNDSLSTYQENSFYELAYTLNLSDSAATSYWVLTSKKNIPDYTNDRIILLLRLTTQLHLEQLATPIYKLGLKLRQNNTIPPVWYQHWEYLTNIGFKEKQKRKILEGSLSSSQPIYSQILGKKKFKVYSKAIRHYLKNNSPKHAEELISQYREENLPVLRRLDVTLQLIRLKFKY